VFPASEFGDCDAQTLAHFGDLPSRVAAGSSRPTGTGFTSSGHSAADQLDRRSEVGGCGSPAPTTPDVALRDSRLLRLLPQDGTRLLVERRCRQSRNQQFVPLKLDAEKYEQLVARLGVRGYPATIVLDAESQHVQTIEGFVGPQKLLKALENRSTQQNPRR